MGYDLRGQYFCLQGENQEEFCVPLRLYIYEFSYRALMGPGRFKAYVSYYLIENFTVRCLFYLRADIGKQIIALFATNSYNSKLIYTNFAMPVFRCCAHKYIH